MDTCNDTPRSPNGVLLQQLQPAMEELAAHKSKGAPNGSPTIEEAQQKFQISVVFEEYEAVERKVNQLMRGNTALSASGKSVNGRNANLVPSSLKSNNHSKQTDKTSSPSGPQPESLKLKLLPEFGQTFKLEGFPQYVARQMGFSDKSECPTLCKLASEYIIRADGCEEEIYNFFANEPAADSLFIKLVEEFERLILSYFAFHWSRASDMISQALVSADKSSCPKKKLKNFVMEATREQRFERVTKNLKVVRVFNTLVEEMKAIGQVAADDSGCTDVVAPMAHKDRSPVLLFMGGGMGAGKSTVLKDILKEPFWVEAKGNAVVIEADAFKESDVIYKALISKGHHRDMLRTAELVHQSSTDAASSLLVTALNEGRDVIMDGTLSWLPFVVQTITMARNIHRKKYRMGPGYRVGEDGSVSENYWEVAEEQDLMDGKRQRRAYRIELAGVVCDAYLAVIRGIRRAIMSRRAVRVNSQLKSHKRFANAFTTYCNLVDVARLYSTNDIEGPAKLIGWKDKDKTLLVEPEEIKLLNVVGRLNEEADSIYELYDHPNPAYEPVSVWKDIVSSPSRSNIQKELKIAIHKIETSSPPHH